MGASAAAGHKKQAPRAIKNCNNAANIGGKYPCAVRKQQPCQESRQREKYLRSSKAEAFLCASPIVVSSKLDVELVRQGLLHRSRAVYLPILSIACYVQHATLDYSSSAGRKSHLRSEAARARRGCPLLCRVGFALCALDYLPSSVVSRVHGRSKPFSFDALLSPFPATEDRRAPPPRLVIGAPPDVFSGLRRPPVPLR